jgi:L-asparagine transporter-like permease
MKMATWLLVLVLIFAVFSTQRSVRRSRSEAERFFTIRISAFSWLVGFIFVFALLFLPNKQRLLLLIPIFFTAVSLGKLWRSGRARVQREQRERDALERMKRIN